MNLLSFDVPPRPLSAIAVPATEQEKIWKERAEKRKRAGKPAFKVTEARRRKDQGDDLVSVSLLET
jgi:hypothetical protein